MTAEQRWQVVWQKQGDRFSKPLVKAKEFGKSDRIVVWQMQNSQTLLNILREPVNETVRAYPGCPNCKSRLKIQPLKQVKHGRVFDERTQTSKRIGGRFV